MAILRKVRTAPRHVKRTVLAVVEGKTEKAFLHYLADVYLPLTARRALRIEDVHGGGPAHIIREALKLRPRRFDIAFIFMDTDIPLEESVARFAESRGLALVGSRPHCIEGMFLALLEPRLDTARWTSWECKEYFEQRYLGRHAKLVPWRYEKIFPRHFLEHARAHHPVMEKLWRLMFEA